MTHDKEITTLSTIADIRAALGVGDKPMLSELPGIVRERQAAVREAFELADDSDNLEFCDDTTDNEQLCRDVAVEVMGWAEDREFPLKTLPYLTSNMGRERELKFTWGDAGRVVEKMFYKNCDFSALMLHPGVYRIRFVNGTTSEEEGYGESESFPEAVFRAALAAKRSQNNG